MTNQTPTRVSLGELITEQGYVVADGAMGTQLFASGLTSGDSPEEWNVSHAAQVQAIHRSYLRAGADLVVTNSFGGTHFRMALHGLLDRVCELNEAAARIARLEADAETKRTGRPIIVAGSMGPTGELLQPLGDMSTGACEDAFGICLVTGSLPFVPAIMLDKTTMLFSVNGESHPKEGLRKHRIPISLLKFFHKRLPCRVRILVTQEVVPIDQIISHLSE